MIACKVQSEGCMVCYEILTVLGGARVEMQICTWLVTTRVDIPSKQAVESSMYVCMYILQHSNTPILQYFNTSILQVCSYSRVL